MMQRLFTVIWMGLFTASLICAISTIQGKDATIADLRSRGDEAIAELRIAESELAGLQAAIAMQKHGAVDQLRSRVIQETRYGACIKKLDRPASGQPVDGCGAHESVNEAYVDFLSTKKVSRFGANLKERADANTR